MLQNLNCAQLAFQGQKWINVGIDMGKNNWVMTAYDYESGKRSRHTFRGATYDIDCYRKIGDLVKTGKDVHVTYEAGRNGFAPARVMEMMYGIKVSILPVNKLEMVSTGKKAKTDGLSATRGSAKPGIQNCAVCWCNWHGYGANGSRTPTWRRSGVQS